MRNKSKDSRLHSWKNIYLLFFLLTVLLSQAACSQNTQNKKVEPKLLIGAEQTQLYFPSLKGKRIGFVGNHTSLINGIHLVDSLLAANLTVVKVFSPEHGFRGDADAGEKVADGIDVETGLPVISLYGKNRKPTARQLEGLDVLLFDIQDVGARFYTYISTLHYVMEAAAENKIPLILLDRPNPNGHYVDGPILEQAHQSFVGMHEVPIVHGMTIGEYAKMINQEGWLSNQVKCELQLIVCQNYDRNQLYEITTPPSPNLPNTKAVLLYPSLCLFEGTPISVGRGTSEPFQQFGHPKFKDLEYSFIPQPTKGAKSPKLKGQKCYGRSFKSRSLTTLFAADSLNLTYLIDSYQAYPKKEAFFTNFFTLLAGTRNLEKQIKQGMTAAEIRASWQKGLSDFRAMRKRYLIYPE